MEQKFTRREIARIAARALEVPFQEIISGSRERRLVRARWAIWLLILELRPETTWKDLGRVLSKDHSSAINGVEEGRRLLKYNSGFAFLVARARRAVLEWRPEDRKVPQRRLKDWAAPKVAETSEIPSAVVYAPPSIAVAIRKPKHDGAFEYDEWFRNECRAADERFRRAIQNAYSELVRVPQKVAAE